MQVQIEIENAEASRKRPPVIQACAAENRDSLPAVLARNSDVPITNPTRRPTVTVDHLVLQPNMPIFHLPIYYSGDIQIFTYNKHRKINISHRRKCSTDIRTTQK